MKNLDNWARLAGAALDARYDLARLIPELDRAITAADTSVLMRVRALAIRHAEALKMALKHPAAGRDTRISRTVQPGARIRRSLAAGEVPPNHTSSVNPKGTYERQNRTART